MLTPPSAPSPDTSTACICDTTKHCWIRIGFLNVYPWLFASPTLETLLEKCWTNYSNCSESAKMSLHVSSQALHVSSQALTLRNTQIMPTTWWSCWHILPPPQPDVRKMFAILCLERWFCSMKMECWVYEGTPMAVWDIPTGSVRVELAFLEQEANHPFVQNLSFHNDS